MSETTKENIRRAFDKARELAEENGRRLRSCAGHDFERKEPETARGIPYLLCKNCGGKLNGSEAHWYLIGLEQGRSEGVT